MSSALYIVHVSRDNNVQRVQYIEHWFNIMYGVKLVSSQMECIKDKLILLMFDNWHIMLTLNLN